MTDKQWEKYADEGMKKASAAMTDKIFSSHTEKEWQKIQEERKQRLDRRKKSGYYDNNPEAALKDWTDLYTARIVCYNYANRMG